MTAVVHTGHWGSAGRGALHARPAFPLSTIERASVLLLNNRRARRPVEQPCQQVNLRTIRAGAFVQAAIGKTAIHQCRSVSCLAWRNAATKAGGNTRKPRRNSGDTALENVPTKITRPSPSIDTSASIGRWPNRTRRSAHLAPAGATQLMESPDEPPARANRSTPNCRKSWGKSINTQFSASRPSCTRHQSITRIVIGRPLAGSPR